MNQINRLIYRVTRFRLMAHHPVHGTKKLHAIRVLKSINQIGDTIHALQYVGMSLKKFMSQTHRFWVDFDRLAWLIFTIAVTMEIMPFKPDKYLAQIHGVRPKMMWLKRQSQRLAGLLHEIHQLMDFQQAHERVKKPL